MAGNLWGGRSWIDSMVESSTDPCDVPPFAQSDAVPGVLSWVTKKSLPPEPVRLSHRQGCD